MNVSSQPSKQDDVRWMRRALRLARRGWGTTTPNPMVGALLVREGRIVGQGCHLRAGGAHAEVKAMAAAGTDARGSTLYVTLEPCSTQGRTPPCTDAVAAAGIRRVVIGCLDPNPRHSGTAVGMLQRGGIQVTVDVCREQCQQLNDAFFCWIQHKRPFVLLKMAMTLDGKIATAAGQSQWITGGGARARVQRLRQWADAIMVGGETVRHDDPSLTVRQPANWWCQPRRIVWTRQTNWPKRLGIWSEPENPPLFAKPEAVQEWTQFLCGLGEQQITALLVEGGGELAAACLRAGVVDKIEFHISPKILGGRGSRPVVAGDNPLSLQDALPIRDVRVRRYGSDLAIAGYLDRCSPD